MANNHMEEIAKMLGVELNEVFRIDGNGHYFRLTDTGLEVSVCTDLADLKHTAWFSEESCMLSDLLTGELKIKKLPWKPAIGDRYCYSDPSSPVMWGRCSWTDYGVDEYRFNHGLVFRTRGEAIALTKKLLAVAQEARNNG